MQGSRSGTDFGFELFDWAKGGDDWLEALNPASLEVLTGAKLEPSLAGAAPASRWQFERMGYFCVDPDATPASPVFNRTVTLRDTWAKIEQRG